MIKSARKPSTDPVQEKLRQSKAVWNKEVSTFVNDLIHYKKLMNGWPNKFHMEKSMIKDPIPADPATIIGSLVSDFNDIAQKGNAIVKQQLDYAKNRKKRQPKQMNLPLGTPAPATPATPEAPPAPDLSKQLALPLAASFEEKYGLIAEGSNPLTRFFTKMLNPGFGLGEAARIRKYRMTLLDSCVKTYKDLGKLQVEVVKSSKNSIHNSTKILNKTWEDWMVVYRGYTTYKSNMPKEVRDAGGEISVTDKKSEDAKQPEANKPSETTEQSTVNEPIEFSMVEKITNDYNSSKSKFPEDASLFNDLNNAFTGYLMAPTPEKKLSAANRIIKLYQGIITLLRGKYNSPGISLEQIASTKDATVATASIEKVAQDFLKKWIGKTRHELSVFDKSSAFRLDIYKMAGEVRKSLDKIMNSLEKGMKLEELDPLVLQVNRDITALRGLMRALYNADPPAPKSKKMPDPENMGMLERMNLLEKYM